MRSSIIVPSNDRKALVRYSMVEKFENTIISKRSEIEKEKAKVKYYIVRDYVVREISNL